MNEPACPCKIFHKMNTWEMQDPDINKIIAGVISSQIDGILKAISVGVIDIRETIRNSITDGLKKYIRNAFLKNAYIRSFFYRDEPTYIYNFYVPVGLVSSRVEIPEANIRQLFAISKKIVIQGTGGSGKSILSKHLFLEILNRKEQIPVLVELRRLNDGNGDLLSLISDNLAFYGFSIECEWLGGAIKGGRIALIFDGFDELVGSLRDEVSVQINDIASQSREVTIIVTSRPDNKFLGWNEFSLFHVAALSKSAANKLVDLAPYDEELKGKFLTELNGSLYEKHESFLSNPLLLSIMLVTFWDAASIPSKISVFYNLAYEALFQRHDAWKGGVSKG